MSFSKKTQKKLDVIASRASAKVMRFEKVPFKLSKGLGGLEARVERERVLNLYSGGELVLHLVKRYKFQLWAVYTVVVSLGLICAILK